MPTLLLLAAFDSQLKWCASLRDEFTRRGFTARAVVPGVRSALSPAQLEAAGFASVEQTSWAEALELAATCDVVVSALSGPVTQSFWFDLAARSAAPVCSAHPGPGPVTISGWVGVIIEKITAGYLDRCGSDVVAVNSVADESHFRTVAARLDLPTDNLLLTGLPFLAGAAAAPRTGPIRRVLFADQPTVPANLEERSFLYRRLADYACAHPDRHVVLKPRHRPDEDTFHRMLHHPETLLAGVDLPGNFAIDYQPITEQLPVTDLLLTLSSTACLEALGAGCRVGLVLDLGVHERYGNQVFLDSGLLRTFDQLIADDIGTAEPAWHQSWFFPRSESAAASIADRAEELLRSGERPSLRVAQTPYVRSAATFHHTVRAPRLHGRARAGRRPLRRRIGQLGHAVIPPILTGPARRVVRLVEGRR